MKKRTAILRSTVGAVAVAIAVQLIPAERTNPPVTREIAWDSPETAEIARASCYDCHSNETVWPWYAKVAPASWLVAKDVSDGREHLNFSMWDGPNEGLDEIVEMIEAGRMPQKRYTFLHPEARLTAEQQQALLVGFRATLEANPSAADAHEDEGHEHD